MSIFAALFMMSTAFQATPAQCSEADIAALEDAKLVKWPGFYREQDVEGLDAFLMDSFVIVTGEGIIVSKAEELAYLADNPWRPTNFTYTIQSLTCPADDMAIIIGEGRSTRIQPSGEQQHVYVSSNILTRVNGKWVAALSHISGERIE